jgi:phage tail sheath protein FI
LNKALDIAEDPETVEMDLLLLPGINNSEITNRMVEVVDERQDSLAIIDLESAYTTSAETTPSQEGKGSLATVISAVRSRKFDSSYAAAYHPWVRVQQKGDTVVTPVPPSVAACGALARSQALTAPWFAPAGFNRGGLTNLGGNNGPSTLSVVETMNKANRDDLYELDINPIARLQGEFVIFGQKTLQQTPSALDRINVRRMMVFLKKRIGRIANTILFDQNIQVTWNKFKSRAERVLNRIKARGGITEFKVVLDSSTTTPDLQDRNILYAKIYVKPAKAIEFIAVDFVITRSGVQF